MTIRQKIGINEPNHNENRGIHGKSINYYTGTGHCPSTGHLYIKATHHEWNNSKEERFPLWLPKTTLCVWMHVMIITQKDIHTLQGQTFIVMKLSIQGTQNHACVIQ